MGLSRQQWKTIWGAFNYWFESCCRAGRCQEHSWSRQKRMLEKLVNRSLRLAAQERKTPRRN